jgi:hypothetical protein
MNDLPPKLSKWLENYEGDKELQIQRFQKYFKIATDNNFQSPRFWSMRQILSQKPDSKIDQKVLKRIRQKNSSQES